MILRNFFFLPFGENAVLFSSSLFTYSRPRTGYNGLLLSTRNLSPFFSMPRTTNSDVLRRLSKYLSRNCICLIPPDGRGGREGRGG